MQNVFELALFALGLTLFAVSVVILWKARRRDYEMLPQLEAITLALSRIEAAVHEEGARARNESSDVARRQGEELSKSLNEFQGSTLTMLSAMSDLQSDRFQTFATHLRATSEATARKLDEMRKTETTIQRLEPPRREGKQTRSATG